MKPIYLDDLFSKKLHLLQTKEDVIRNLTYEIAKQIYNSEKQNLIFFFNIDRSSKRLQYIQYKCLRSLKRLYKIKASRVIHDKNRYSLKLIR